MVDIDDIPDFPGLPGQRPVVGAPPAVAPVAIVLVNAPLDSDYVNIAHTTLDVDAYINTEYVAGRGYDTTVERWSPWSDLQLQIPYQDAVKFNYARFSVGGRFWYAFLEAEYLNLTDTRYRITPDVWTTYDANIGYSTVVRGHVAVAASVNDTYGDQYLLEPEPIDAPPLIGAVTGEVFESDLDSWTAIVVSANDLRGSGATPFFQVHRYSEQVLLAAEQARSAGAFQVDIPEVVYPWASTDVYIPFVTPAPPSTIDGVPAGGGVFVFSLSGLRSYLSIMQNAPWVVEGISSIRLVPAWCVPNDETTWFTATPPTNPTSALWASAATTPDYIEHLVTLKPTETAIANWRSTALSAINASGWAKLTTSQFCEIIVGSDAVTTLTPEAIHSTSLQFQALSGAAHGGSSVALPINYANQDDVTPIELVGSGLATPITAGYGSALSNVANMDMALNVLSESNFGNVSNINRNHDLAFDLSMTGIQMSLGVQTANTIMGGPHAVLPGLQSIATSAMSGANNLTLLDVSNEVSESIAREQMGWGGRIAARTLQIMIDSAVSRSGQGGVHTIPGWKAANNGGLSVVVRMPAPDRVKAAISLWERFGYMIRRAFTPPRLDPMTKFSYWQLEAPTVTGAMPQEARATIARAFERGTTVWTSVAEIGTHPTNTPNPGVTY